jgi:hypothetical protein
VGEQGVIDTAVSQEVEGLLALKLMHVITYKYRLAQSIA